MIMGKPAASVFKV